MVSWGNKPMAITLEDAQADIEETLANVQDDLETARQEVIRLEKTEATLQRVLKAFDEPEEEVRSYAD